MTALFSNLRLRLALGSVFIIFLLGFWAKLSGHDYNAYLTATMNRRNAVIFLLVSPSRLTQALGALQNAEDRFNRRLKYPIVLFTAEDEVGFITDELRMKASRITEGRATFATTTKESWEVPSWMDKERVKSSMDNIGFSLGYRSMCRFYSGFFWKHPALKSYDWLWRLDTDIHFHCDVPYDPIERLIEKKAVYGFVQVTYDVSWVQPSLASNVSQFLYENRPIIPPDANQHFAWKGGQGVANAMSGTANNNDWTGANMYVSKSTFSDERLRYLTRNLALENNIEISHRSVWEGEIYTKFFEYLERAGGFFYERWGDAPVHSYGIAMSLRKDQVVQFSNLGYQHQGWPYECPGLDRCACVIDSASRDFDDNAHAWFNPQ